MEKSDREYIYYLVFEKSDDYRNVAEMLNNFPGFNSVRDQMESMVCPDGIPRPALRVPYDPAKQVLASSSSLQGKVYLLRETFNKGKSTGYLEFWPPGSGPKRKNK